MLFNLVFIKKQDLTLIYKVEGMYLINVFFLFSWSFSTMITKIKEIQGILHKQELVYED